jgi:hypothetical protein
MPVGPNGHDRTLAYSGTPHRRGPMTATEITNTRRSP